MSIRLSSIVPASSRGNGRGFSVKSVDLHAFGALSLPIEMLDDFRVRGRQFPPHPHAGFSAVTYVFKDSMAGLRSRASFGNDAVVGPGGIVWTQAGSGAIHEEMPAETDRELHGLQIFVNLSAKNKLIAPCILSLEGDNVPHWRNEARDIVRVVVGAYGHIRSPLVPAEPFTLLDIDLSREIAFDLPMGQAGLAYVVSGTVVVRADGVEREVASEAAVALSGDGLVTFRSISSAHIILLAGAENREPVLSHGPFIMNEPSQIEAAIARYRAGKMGRLPCLNEGGHHR